MAAQVARTGKTVRDPGRRQLVRAVAATTVATTIVWYDFFLYGFAATLVLGRLFFPSRDAYASALLALGTYFVGFAARPLGAMLFGHLGDRIGRRATLIATLLLMGLATTLVGVAPTYAEAGVFGGILLTLLRVVQGLSAGGEWAGSALLSIEWGHRGRRGLLGSWTQLALPAGLALAYGSLQLFTTWLGQDAGWRWPFLLSVVLVVVAVYIRLGVRETPVFTKLLDGRRIEQSPVLEAVARHWREVALVTLLRIGQQVPFYVFTVFVLTYATDTLRFQQSQVLYPVLIAAAVSVLTTPLWGLLSDFVGRRRLVVIGAAAMLVWSYPYFMLLDMRMPMLLLVAIVASLPIHDMQHGPQAALIAESFTGRVRYSGASLGYNLVALLADGPAPLVAFALLHAFGSSVSIAVYMGACALVSLLAALGLRDRSRQDMSVEYDEPVGALPAATPTQS
jgi:MFS family permease